MKNSIKIALFSIIVVAMAGACKKDDNPDTKDIYVAGAETNANGIYVAKIWKNGIATDLSDGNRSPLATFAS